MTDDTDMNAMTDNNVSEKVGFDVDDALKQGDYDRDELMELAETGYQFLKSTYVDQAHGDNDNYVFADGLFRKKQSDGYIYINRRKLASMAELFAEAAGELQRKEKRIDTLEKHRNHNQRKVEEYKNESLLDFVRRRYL